MRKTLCLSIILLLPFLFSCASSGPGSGKDPGKFRGTFSRSDFDVPIVLNEKTASWIEFFQGRGRKHFARHLERSHRYIPDMQKILKEHGLPKDLVYIALIESGFSAKARSHANAVGFWQFISATGRRYNLKINRHVDERSDFVKATHAAARYLKDLHNMFGDWYLAAAAYNAGEGTIMRAIKKKGTKDYWKIADSRYLRKETKNYIPKYLAAMIIAKRPERFGFTNLVPQEPLKYETVTIKGNPIDLRVAAKLIQRDRKELETLNPELRIPITPTNRKHYALRVPEESAGRFRSKLASLPRHMRMARKEHKVKSGETLETLAKNHGMSIRYMAMANGLKEKSTLKPGQRIGIPYMPPKNMWRYSGGGKTRYYKVRPGDSLWKIARKHNVPLKKLRAWNKGKIGRHLKPGQKIALRGKIKKKGRKSTVVASSSKKSRSTKTKTYRVKEGDSLWTIASAHGVSVSELKAWNKGKIKRYLKLGQKITIKGAKGTTVASSDVKKTPGVSPKTITKGGKTYHVVQSGDTLSTVAEMYGVRTRDLKSWNKGRLKKYLRLGQRLEIRGAKKTPAKTTTVASAKKSSSAPSTTTRKKTPKAKGTYKVKDGDSLWTIANRNSVSVSDLKKWNKGKLGRHLKPGQRIKIVKAGAPAASKPRKPKTETIAKANPSTPVPTITTVEHKKTLFHTISSGDTLWDIARKYGVSTSDIKKWNGIDQVKYLRPGKKLKIYVKRVAAIR